MQRDTLGCLGAVLVCGLVRLAASLITGDGLQVAAVNAGLLALVVAGPVRVYWRYQRHPDWGDVPAHHAVAVVVVDLFTFAWLAAALQTFNARVSDGRPPRQTQIETAVAVILVSESTAKDKGGYRDVKDAARSFAKLHLRDIGWPFLEGWLQEVAAVTFGFLVAAAGAASAVHFGLATRDDAPVVFLAILAAATVSQVLAGLTHLFDKTTWHQVWMISSAFTIMGLGLHLSIAGVGFRSDISDLAGRIMGFAFPLTLLAWQFLAAKDRGPRRTCCRSAAGLAAVFGLAWAGLNVADRVLEPPSSLEDVVALVWPLCLAASASMAALSPARWGVGSGPKAREDRERRHAA